MQYFNSEDETTLQCDATDTDLGATLMQKGQPVAFASRAVTPTERNYAQIEKDILAIVFGMEKFNHFTYGRKVTVVSDHKPLETIHKKLLASAPKRLQGMLLHLQRYEFNIVYKQGKDIVYHRHTLQSIYCRLAKQPITAAGVRKHGGLSPHLVYKIT